MKKFQTTAIAAFAALLTAGAVGAEAQQAAGTGLQLQRIGPFKVTFGVMTGSHKSGTFTFDFRGKPGGKVKAATTRYSLIAPRIQFLITPTHSPESAQATGGVEGEARDPDRQQVISFSGDKGVYTTGDKTAPAQIDLTGNVRFVFRNPQFSAADPLIVHGSSGFVRFAPDGSINYGLNSGEASGTAVDAPKKKP